MRAKILLPLLLLLALVAALVLFDRERRRSSDETKQTQGTLQEMQEANPAQNQQKAKEVLERVRRHIVLENAGEATVAAIVDSEKLREKNAFYRKAKNGDYLIVTRDRAILYDFEHDVIIDVTPVQLDAK